MTDSPYRHNEKTEESPKKARWKKPTAYQLAKMWLFFVVLAPNVLFLLTRSDSWLVTAGIVDFSLATVVTIVAIVTVVEENKDRNNW